MQRWHDLTGVPGELSRPGSGCVLTIGVFDGVHLGHQRVIARTVELARAEGVPAVVMTFDPHPMAVVRPEFAPDLLAPVDQRLERIEAAGADAALVLPFTTERSAQPAEDFVREVAGALGPRVIVVGDDFRFGHKAAGDVGLLERLGGELGFRVEVVRRDNGERRWSSSAVRTALAEGDVETVTRLSGHPFRVDGVVVRGAGRGRAMLGFPTANVPVRAGFAVPADGVYAGWLIRRDVPADASGVRLPAAISVGTNPQFGEDPRQVESYVLDRDDLDLYGERVGVEFTTRIRGQQTFDSVPALIEQMRKDVDRARVILT